MMKWLGEICHSTAIESVSDAFYRCNICKVNYLKSETMLVNKQLCALPEEVINMKIKVASGSGFLNAKIVKEEKLNKKELKISGVSEQTIKEDSKYVLSFEGVDRGLPLNATNKKILVAEFGDESDNWLGKKIHLTIVKVSFNNEMVDSIQVVVE